MSNEDLQVLPDVKMDTDKWWMKFLTARMR